MIIRKAFSSIVLALCVLVSFAQNHHSRFESIDVQHYKFEIHLNDTTNRIEGTAAISIKFLQAANDITLDLVNKSGDNGMLVYSIQKDGNDLDFKQANNKLEILLNEQVQAGSVVKFYVAYSGIPTDGLIISENKYGKRTFFGDNWPDRAQYWLPCVDHPSDKATLEFLVYAPEHYEVVSNGLRVEKKQLPDNMEFTHWKEDVPISTKLMVIGVADFAVGNKFKANDIPISSWVFEENKEQGFKNYKYGAEALNYFSELIGPYSYEKLAHVQSKTRYGGMENATCIFYNENTGTSDRSQEGLFAHEVAHQWFGNSVTEQNWHHVWLSEGFATYLTNVYMQHFYGDEVFKERLKGDRERVIAYSKRNLAPIIDTTVTEYIRLLNPNSYQKANWFLHMLRIKLGDKTFFEGLQKYYHEYQNSTALTKDFQQVMEAVSGEDLSYFFNQWLRQAGHPIFDISSETLEQKEVIIKLRQIQKGYFYRLPIDIKIIYNDKTSETKTLYMDGIKKEIECSFDTKPGNLKIIIDPDVKLLFEANREKFMYFFGQIIDPIKKS
ncbi:M1 family metallopeptidase [Draconibacterium sp. IB214405]|uniref:M1 family metallopeptidase n=1 Tax=Draconibacterium sp. IB214405 TaxID=3097352 RepID=UPI002A172556|nr:M1 family metallopeptidase [Draconibacterium sp. IB214405]MDX8339698.1 M1 family metallopeptidase [Draconibacterium sp. IB214405]